MIKLLQFPQIITPNEWIRLKLPPLCENLTIFGNFLAEYKFHALLWKDLGFLLVIVWKNDQIYNADLSSRLS